MEIEVAPDFSIGKYHWNHRVVRYKDGSLGIHEAHYSTPGVTSGPCSITTDPVGVCGEDIDSLLWTLGKMRECLAWPILNHETCEEEKPAQG